MNAATVLGDFDGGLAYGVSAILQSPHFLYRTETGVDGQLTDLELASKLSFFLWDTIPDEDLLAAAEAGTLSGDLDAVVEAMIADPRSKALFDSFAMQWLGLRRLEQFTPDLKLMPNFKIEVPATWPDLRSDMLTETGLFFTEIVRENRSILDLIDARFTYVNKRLALLYDIGDTNGNPMQSKTKPTNPGEPIPPILIFESNPEGTVVQSHNPFVRVNLENTRRSGLLTQASVLAVTSHPKRTSLVKRGHWILEQILGTPPPPPPPNVPSLDRKSTRLNSSHRT